MDKICMMFGPNMCRSALHQICDAIYCTKYVEPSPHACGYLGFYPSRMSVLFKLNPFCNKKRSIQVYKCNNLDLRETEVQDGARRT